MSRIQRLSELLSRDPGNLDLACELADACYAEQDWEALRSHLQALPATLVEQPGIRFRRARLALVDGDFDAAAAILRGLQSEGLASAGLQHDLAFADMCAGRHAAAQAILRDALQRWPTPELHLLDARIHHLAGEFDAALRAVDAALRLDASHATALGLRALLLLDSGQTSAASDAAAACLRTAPMQYEALLTAGTAALWAQQPAAAEQALERCLSLQPRAGRALSAMGQVRMLQGDLAAGQSLLQQAVQSMPDHIGSWHALAWCHLLQGDIAAAEHCYRQALALDRNFGETHAGLAIVSALRGERAAAEQSLERAQRLSREAPTVRYAQSLLASIGGDPQAAERILAGLLSAAPGASALDPKTVGDTLQRLFRGQPRG